MYRVRSDGAYSRLCGLAIRIQIIECVIDHKNLTYKLVTQATPISERVEMGVACETTFKY